MNKIGEYVRTKNGYIGKIITRQGGYGLRYELDINKEIQNNWKYGWIHEDNIKKHSFNKIDLIEDFDYVNGYLCRNINGKMCNFDLNMMEWTPLENIDIWDNILTHEQYENNCYRLE